jgi:hypothetical protein
VCRAWPRRRTRLHIKKLTLVTRADSAADGARFVVTFTKKRGIRVGWRFNGSRLRAGPSGCRVTHPTKTHAVTLVPSVPLFHTLQWERELGGRACDNQLRGRSLEPHPHVPFQLVFTISDHSVIRKNGDAVHFDGDTSKGGLTVG